MMKRKVLQLVSISGLIVASSGVCLLIYAGVFRGTIVPEYALLTVPISYLLLVLPATADTSKNRKS
jgi:hypothetical protein